MAFDYESILGNAGDSAISGAKSSLAGSLNNFLGVSKPPKQSPQIVRPPITKNSINFKDPKILGGGIVAVLGLFLLTR
jgi:hypothetical protein